MVENFNVGDTVLDIYTNMFVTILTTVVEDEDCLVRYPSGTEEYVKPGVLVAQDTLVFQVNDRVRDYFGKEFTVVGPPDFEGDYCVNNIHGDVVYRHHSQLTLVTHEAVVHPTHYNTHPSGVECIELIRDMPFSLGSAVKYVWRTGLKDTATAEEDLKKARFLLKDFLTEGGGGVAVDKDTLHRVIRETPVKTPLWYVLLGVMFTGQNLVESANVMFSHVLDEDIKESD